MRRRFVLLGATVLVSACWGKKKPKGPPPPPPQVTLRKDAALRAAATAEAPLVADLPKGTKVSVLRLRDRWCRVKTEKGDEGFLERSTFARRTVLFGTGRFPYTGAVADALRRVPTVDLVRQETTARLMPGGPAGGVEGAGQLAGGLRAEVVVGVMAGGRQFVYEIVDLANDRVLLSGTTDDTMYLQQAVNELAASVAYALDQSAKPAASPTPEGAATATPSATPTPKPTSPHPNAPLEPTGAATATPTPGASPSPAPSPSPSPSPARVP